MTAVAFQPFKENDATEALMHQAFLEAVAATDVALDAFYSGADTCFALGDVLYETERSPLVDSIDQEAFRQIFSTLFAFFERPGSFEYYLTVFRAIWGDDVEVEFTVPSPGVLEINIEAATLTNYEFASRYIVNNEYFFEEVVTDGGENIAFRLLSGIRTQEQVDALMRELAPAGIYATATLTTT